MRALTASGFILAAWLPVLACMASGARQACPANVYPLAISAASSV